MSDTAEVAVIEQPERVSAQAPVVHGPDTLLALAVEKDMDLDKLEKLMEMKKQYDAEEARKEFFDAFAAFQSLVPTLKKTKEGHNYKYAPLGDIAKQIQSSLEQCSLSYRFGIQDAGDLITVACRVSHRNGHTEETSMTGSPDTSGSKNTIQARGSVVSYLQRYTLIAALGLTTADEDIDARVGVEGITTGQAASIKARLEHTAANVEKFCHVLRIPNVDAMPAATYAKADRILTQKETKLAEEVTNADS